MLFCSMNQNNKKHIVVLIIIAFLGGILLIPTTSSSATSNVGVNFMAHKNTSSLNSGLVGNTTQLFESSSATVTGGATSSSQFVTSWDLYPCLASSITIVPGNVVFTVFVNANQSLSGVTLGAQLNEIASCGTGSETTLFGGEATSSISLTSSAASHTVSISIPSNTVIPTGDTLHFIVYVNPNTSHQYTITISYDAIATDTYFSIPMQSQITSSLSISPNAISAPSTSLATLTVSDALGLYDVSNTLTASLPGFSVNPINSQAMTASSSNSPTGYTGTWTLTVNPSITSYSAFSGIWNIQSTTNDNSGNSYTSNIAQLNYQASSGPGTNVITTSTSSSQDQGLSTLSQMQALGLLLMAAIIITAGMVLYKKR